MRVALPAAAVPSSRFCGGSLACPGSWRPNTRDLQPASTRLVFENASGVEPTGIVGPSGLKESSGKANHQPQLSALLRVMWARSKPLDRGTGRGRDSYPGETNPRASDRAVHAAQFVSGKTISTCSAFQPLNRPFDRSHGRFHRRRGRSSRRPVAMLSYRYWRPRLFTRDPHGGRAVAST